MLAPQPGHYGPAADDPGRELVRSRAAGHADAAGRAIEGLADPGTVAIVNGLLAIATAIEDTAERATGDLDAAAAMIAERISDVNDVIDAATGAALIPDAGPLRRIPVREAFAWLRHRWRARRGTAPVPFVTLDCAGMCGQPAHQCGSCACAGGCRCPLRCRCAEASR